MRSPLLLTFVLAVCALGQPAAASAQVIGYAGLNQEILELQLRPFGEGIPVSDRLQLFSSEEVQGLARSPDGTLYAATIDGLDSVSLYEVDFVAGTVGAPRSLGLLEGARLAFDETGLLWVQDGADLYSYDIPTETLTLELTLTPDIVGIAWWKGELYVLFDSPGEGVGPSLGLVDPATGSLVRSRELPWLIPEPGSTLLHDSLSFDDEGGLWIGSRLGIGGIITLPVIFGHVSYFDDPWTDDDPELRIVDGATLTFAMPLTVVGSVPAVDVPGLRGSGMLVLALLLSGAALLLLRPRIRRTVRWIP